MFSIFLFYLLLLTQKENNEKEKENLFYKKCSQNGSYPKNIHRLLILFTDFFHAIFYLFLNFVRFNQRFKGYVQNFMSIAALEPEIW